MDVRYINPFLKSCCRLFDTMIKVAVQIKKPALKTHATPQFMVSAVIGLSGGMTGSVVIGFPTNVAISLASALAQAQFKAIDADCVDALGEIANMIAGAAKKDLPADQISISTPTVIIGAHNVAYPQNVPIIVIPCETPVGPFVIEIALRPTAKPPAELPAAPVAAATPAPAAAAV